MIDELLAGLRKLGHSSPEGIRSATLEETGHISAIPLEREEPAPPTSRVSPPLPAWGNPNTEGEDVPLCARERGQLG